jgi:hypothetical protein
MVGDKRNSNKNQLIGATLIVVLSLVLIISMFPPLELMDYAYFALSIGFNVAPEVFIMISDLLLLLAGVLLAYSLDRFLSVDSSNSDVVDSLNARLNKGGMPSLVAAAVIIVYWHLPSVVDSALLNFDLHVIMHAWLVVAGILIFMGAGLLSARVRKIAAIFGCKAMGIFGVFLLVTSGAGYNRFYSIYPISEQAQLGLTMMLMMFVFEGFLVPYWLYKYFTSPMPSSISQ